MFHGDLHYSNNCDFLAVNQLSRLHIVLTQHRSLFQRIIQLINAIGDEASIGC